MFQGFLNFKEQEKIMTKDLFRNIKNNFTYEFWIKPQKELNLNWELDEGKYGASDQGFIISPGKFAIKQKEESGAGISVGTNGITVYEHSCDGIFALLTYERTIDDWTHIAIVYENKIPNLYVDGNFIKKGLKSFKNHIFASGNIGGYELNGYFEGKLNHLRIWDYSKNEKEIKSHMDKCLDGNEQGLILNLNYEKPTYIQSISNATREADEPSFFNDSILNQFSLETLNELNYVEYNNDLLEDTEVDVIIPIYNGYEFTKRCIESIYNNVDIRFNLFLINDASTDERIYRFLESLKSKKSPQSLKKLVIIHNDKNLGYVQSINKGLLLTTNHPILLNSDTEIPPHCFRRLINPILVNDKISSVTPFSNSATICSYPNFVQDNGLPYNMTANEVDSYFSKYVINKGIVIPTGVGFCMALNRNVIHDIGIFDDEVFGKGYGEENDWCMRAQHKGYQNILIPNVFVYHKHGVSFNQIDGSKQELMSSNLKKLLSRYPNYNKIIQEFIRLDPIKNIRDFIKSVMVADKYSYKKGRLFIDHGLGGGASIYQTNYIKTLEDDERIYTLTPGTDYVILTDHNHPEPIEYNLNISKLNETNFKKLLSALNIDLIFINHLFKYPIEKMFRLIKHSLVDYYFYIHDFYCVCPSYNLINHQKKYCNAETNVETCQGCIAKIFSNQAIHIEEWRKTFHSLLMGAKKVITPSHNTKDIILKYYKDIEIEVREHVIDSKITHSFKEEFLNKEALNIAFVGAIDYPKGSSIIYELKELIVKENLPINIKVIGITNIHFNPHKSAEGKFEVTGRYQVDNLSDMLAKNEIALVINPSICPETYSYTTSEAMLSGYPIITFNLGAPAERIEKYQCGWIIDNMTSSEILKVLKRLLNNREEINEKAKKLKELQKGRV
ncbi:glycosyltransferase [Bacillus pseudomycoides]|uniref:Glycosyltransferase n=1 Tax=Bacillus bingmayongensis TaxID=1150157 RepID=A0ABU5JSA8_9BACI|nr:glycosyltransferase [Bacillus pseudomycoides]